MPALCRPGKVLYLWTLGEHTHLTDIFKRRAKATNSVRSCLAQGKEAHRPVDHVQYLKQGRHQNVWTQGDNETATSLDLHRRIRGAAAALFEVAIHRCRVSTTRAGAATGTVSVRLSRWCKWRYILYGTASAVSKAALCRRLACVVHTSRSNGRRGGGPPPHSFRVVPSTISAI